MKKFIIISLIVFYVANSYTQSNDNFCDPALQNEVGKIANMGGTYLKDFLISPQDLILNQKSGKIGYYATIVLIEGTTYRFYLLSSSKIACEATFTLYEKDCDITKPLSTIQQKSNEPVAFENIDILHSGVYDMSVTFKDNIKGCALVLINFISNNKSPNNISDVDTSIVYEQVDENAQFNGGDLNNFRNYVAMNFKVDTGIMKINLGKIFIQFIVNTAGKIEKAEILRSCGKQALDNEGLRVINSSPTWTPAKIKGVNVKQKFVLPIKIN